jgi:hypothetical protein
LSSLWDWFCEARASGYDAGGTWVEEMGPLGVSDFVLMLRSRGISAAKVRLEDCTYSRLVSFCELYFELIQDAPLMIGTKDHTVLVIGVSSDKSLVAFDPMDAGKARLDLVGQKFDSLDLSNYNLLIISSCLPAIPFVSSGKSILAIPARFFGVFLKMVKYFYNQ